MIDVKGEEIPFTMMIRRARLIDALYSEEFCQGKSFLWTDYDLDRQLQSDNGYFCCIGVACYLDGISTRVLTHSQHACYKAFNERYGVDEKFQQYLIACNDGWHLSASEFTHIGKRLGILKVLRSRKRRMSFAKIARFLEIAWAMTY